MNERWNFETEGYAVIRSFFEPAELDTVVNAVGDVLASPSDPSMNRTGNELFPLRWNDPIAATSLQATSSMSALRDATDVRNLGWISGYVSTKCGRSPALGWHQDWWCWDHPASFQRQATQIAVLCHLSDTTKKNGALLLRVLPGSHHAHTATHRLLPEAHGESACMLPVDHPALNSVAGEVTLGLRAGNAAVLDYRLLYGTHPNNFIHTKGRRSSVLCTRLGAHTC
jgi:hypothetical protein